MHQNRIWKTGFPRAILMHIDLAAYGGKSFLHKNTVFNKMHQLVKIPVDNHRII